MEYPLVTIGIPTYNRADGFLKDAVKSAMAQNYSNIEIIVSDNCSKDNTAQVVQGFGDSRISYHRHQENIGAENNFNFCLDQAKGDYFLLLHDDDLIDPDFVDACMRAAGGKTCFGTIRTGVRVIDANGTVQRESENRVTGDTFEDSLLAWFNHESPWYLCNTLFNTQKLKQIGGFRSKHKLLQDGMAVTKLAAQYPKLNIPDVKASIRKHGDEITFAVRVKDWVDDFLILLDLMVELAPNDKDSIKKAGHRFFAYLSYGRASAVEPRLKRWLTYLMVFRQFNFKYLPPPLRSKITRATTFFRNT
jgi:glycosyltransferase involved in cell wall biosynthesis